MDKFMDNVNLWHLRDHIFRYLNLESVKTCRQVCKFWNESLERILYVKFLQEFGDREIEFQNEKVSSYIPGWQKAMKKYGAQASIEDLQKVKDSLRKLVTLNGKCLNRPVRQAAMNGDVNLMEIILNTSYDFNDRREGCTPLEWACQSGRTEIVQLLINSSKDSGIDLNAKDNDGRTALHLPCFAVLSDDSIAKRTEIVQLLIKSSKDFGIDLNARDVTGCTAFLIACRCGNTEIVQSFVTSSKEFNIDLNTRDDKGRTAFQIACIYGNTEIVQSFVTSSKEFNIDLNTRDDKGCTAFHRACCGGRKAAETVQFFITSSKNFNIDLNARDDKGWTALHWACKFAQTELVELLVKNLKEFGLDINAQDNQGKAPLDLAKEQIHQPYFHPGKKEHLEKIIKILEVEYSKTRNPRRPLRRMLLARPAGGWLALLATTPGERPPPPTP